MKTKKEIEQLAKQLCNIPIDLVIDEEERYYKNLDKYDGIIQGYIKCQEDMADKKYTEDDIRKAIQVGISAEAGDYPEGFTYKLGISLEDYYILELLNSLNKQD